RHPSEEGSGRGGNGTGPRTGAPLSDDAGPTGGWLLQAGLHFRPSSVRSVQAAEDLPPGAVSVAMIPELGPSEGTSAARLTGFTPCQESRRGRSTHARAGLARASGPVPGRR